MAQDYAPLLAGVLPQFLLYGDLECTEPLGGGHINTTFRSQWDQAGAKVRYTHQRINEKVFVRPDQVMENIVRVTRHIAEKLLREGTPGRSRRVLTVVPSRDGKPWVRDAEGGWWRTYLFIEGTHTPELVSSIEEARFLGESAALFQRQLADLDGARLHETIPDFHNMESRYRRFHEAVSRDAAGRLKDVRDEIAFMEKNEDRGGSLIRALKDGSIPERICHNDTKISNILVDNKDSRACCVIDLDTVMPGTSLFDLGDLIRTVSARTAEDEQDLDKVAFDPAYFEALLDGYLSQASQFLIPKETELLCEAGRNITQIMGLRFLTDYLEGDHYYFTARSGHNLDRCRNQIALIRSMDARRAAAAEIAEELVNRHC